MIFLTVRFTNDSTLPSVPMLKPARICVIVPTSTVIVVEVSSVSVWEPVVPAVTKKALKCVTVGSIRALFTMG
ncbi:hypothetical protein ACBJ59_55855 [Nonomuraea sp. MTCD27]|uniref:hypothetical protein n=1 Tax=Nonomuraea sp. MTCD27 TaxID=1676747 RepID=UPI0035C2348A